MKPDGGPAFPRVAHPSAPDGIHHFHYAEDGMSLRDYFAAKAMAAALSNSATMRLYAKCVLAADNPSFGHLVAQGAYHYADAMLKARDQQPTS